MRHRRGRDTLARVVAVLVVAAGVVVGVPLAPTEAGAQVANATLVVDSTGDQGDADLLDGLCRTSVGTCTLRAAIQQANASRGPGQIDFAIPGGGVKRIQPRGALPALNDGSGTTIIDGYSQPGASVNTAQAGSNANILIEVVGSNQAHGIRIESAGNTVRGLSISGFVINVHLTGEGADGNRIVGNFIGALADGSQGRIATGSRYTHGVNLALGPDRNVIGAPTLADRNVISGNGTWGIAIDHGETSENLVQNNVIGLTPDLGSNLAQNIGIDIQWWTWGNLIGGDRPLEGNLISGNQRTRSDAFHAAVDLSHDAIGNQVIGNHIGTLGDGDSIAPHSANTQGFAIKDNANDNYVADNVIVNSLYDGIKHRHNYSSGNVFVGNRIGIGANGSPGSNRYGVVLNGHDQLMLDNLIAYNRSGGVLVLDSRLPLSSTTRYRPEHTLDNALRQTTLHSNGAGSGGTRTQIDAHTYGEAAAVDGNDAIYRYTNGTPTPVSGFLVHVSIGTDGALWGINASNSVYRRAANATSWQQVADDLTLVQIDARTYDEAVAVDSNNQVYRFGNGAWSEVGGRLKHVSIGTDGALWGVDADDYIYRRTATGTSWHLVSGRLAQVDALTYEVSAGVNSGDAIYRYTGTRWQRISGGLSHVSIGTDGSLWGVNVNEDVYRRAANATGWQRLSNSNAGTGLDTIDLYPAGPTPNDAGDRDDGPHRLLNTPVFTGLAWVDGAGEVYGTACAGCTIEFSVSGALRPDGTLDPADPAGRAGATWAGTVTAGNDGTFSLRDSRFQPGKLISAIAIDTTGNTSEMVDRAMSTQPFGVIGTNPDTSQPRMERPAAPARPQPWSPPTFSCNHDGSTLSWDDAGAAEYYVFAVVDGAETYLGPRTGTSTTAAAAQSYRVEHWVNGFATNAICPGPGPGDPGAFVCSAAAGVLSWDDAGADEYYVFANTGGTERYLGGHQTTSLTVTAADSYRVEHWLTGQATNATCPGPGGPGPFACSVTAGILTWDDAGADEYYVFANTGGTERYLGGHRATSLTVNPADSYRVEHWLTGQATNATCG